MARFRLLRETHTYAGWRRSDIRSPLTGADRLIMHGKNTAQVIETANHIGVYGRLVAIEVDENDRPVTVEKVSA